MRTKKIQNDSLINSISLGDLVKFKCEHYDGYSTYVKKYVGIFLGNKKEYSDDEEESIYSFFIIQNKKNELKNQVRDFYKPDIGITEIISKY